jgi:hypothetical protein
LKLKNKEEGDKQCSSLVVGVVEGSFEGSELAPAVTLVDGRFHDEWVHDWFTTYGSVFMGNDVIARFLVLVQSK